MMWKLVLALALAIGVRAEFFKTVLATNLTEPIQLSIAKDGRVLFGERGGAVKMWDPKSNATRTIGKLNVNPGPEDGLLGFALDPGFLTNGWVYIFHSAHTILENHVSRFTVTNGEMDLSSEKVLLRIPTLAKKPNHSGGGLGFDGAGNLYASTGDYTYLNESQNFAPLDRRPGREVFDSERTAANTMDFRGKILRIHPEADGSYTIPKGNLFPPGTAKTLPEIYIMGCRNPFRFVVDEKTGWLIWGDVGPDALQSDPKRGPAGFDEFNVAKRAGNFGWPYFLADNRPYVRYDFATKESGEPFDPAHPVNESPNNTGLRELPSAQPAIIWYPPGPSARYPQFGSGARSAMAGAVYHFDPELKSGRKFPKDRDGLVYIYEWERSWIAEMRLDSDAKLQNVKLFAPEIKIKRPISMQFGPDGALYLIEWGAAWYKNTDSVLSRFEFSESR